jgi:ABC-2 type transport system ATP-binding protein
MSAGDLAIDVSGVTKRFGTKTVVNGIDLQVRTGEIYGFLGPNGSGKTTFIRMLCGLLTPDAGSGTCLGRDILTEQPHIKREVGYMTQKLQLLRGPEHPREPGLHRADLRGPGPQEGRPGKPRAPRPAEPQRPARGRALGRLEAAPRARGLPDPQAAPPPPRRADGGRRPEGPQGVLGRAPQALDRGDHGPHHDPLHGRGRALPPDRLPRLRQPPRARDGGGRGRQGRLTTWSVEGPDLAKLAESLRGQPGIEQVVPFGSALHVSGRTRRDRGHARAGLRAEHKHTQDRIRPRGRVHRPHGPATDNYS